MMTPDEQDGFAVHDLIEEIRLRASTDIIQLLAACREITTVLEDNEALVLIMPEVWRQTLFLRAMKDVKVCLWRALKNVEITKIRMPVNGLPQPQKVTQK